ncbi:hypothetical protein [Mammaliicoccus lentus]|jgi:hypothetical protein|uniref:hypothetical protein n=1 Tax=Mammaliicoccus lentus TaxID=42858 RepID=UPI003517210E
MADSLSEYQFRNIFEELQEDEIIIKEGNCSSTHYELIDLKKLTYSEIKKD